MNQCMADVWNIIAPNLFISSTEKIPKILNHQMVQGQRGLDFIALEFITLFCYCLYCNSLWRVTGIPDNNDMELYSKDQNPCVHPNFCMHVTCNASISNVSFVAKWCHTTCCTAHKPAPSNKTCINSNLSNLILRCQIHWDKILNLNWKRKQNILLHFFALILFLFYFY